MKDNRGLVIDLICTRHKHGRALIEHTEKLAKKQGMKWLKLYAVNRKTLLEWYKKRGYKFIAKPCEQKAMKREKHGDEFIMSKCFAVHTPRMRAPRAQPRQGARQSNRNR
jgi:N-acetylglutamate synthase-like GNAT family acetyltransferase